jgi:hypothetical protein
VPAVAEITGGAFFLRVARRFGGAGGAVAGAPDGGVVLSTTGAGGDGVGAFGASGSGAVGRTLGPSTGAGTTGDGSG